MPQTMTVCLRYCPNVVTRSALESTTWLADADCWLSWSAKRSIVIGKFVDLASDSAAERVDGPTNTIGKSMSDTVSIRLLTMCLLGLCVVRVFALGRLSARFSPPSYTQMLSPFFNPR